MPLYNTHNVMLTMKRTRTIDWIPVLKMHKNSVRLVAQTPEGGRIPHGNLIKFKPDGSIYLYHTVNPQLGLRLNNEGRILVL